MESDSPFLLLGVASRAAPGQPSVRAGRVTGLMAGRLPDPLPDRLADRLPASALRLPQPLGFGTITEIRSWLMVREARLATALRLLAGCREVGLDLHEDVPRHAAWLRARDQGLARGASASPARAARRAMVARRLEAILAVEARTAVLPDPAREVQPSSWAVGVPEAAVARLRSALETEARKLSGTGLTLHLRPSGESAELARAVLQDS